MITKRFALAKTMPIDPGYPVIPVIIGIFLTESSAIDYAKTNKLSPDNHDVLPLVWEQESEPEQLQDIITFQPIDAVTMRPYGNMVSVRKLEIRSVASVGTGAMRRYVVYLKNGNRYDVLYGTAKF